MLTLITSLYNEEGEVLDFLNHIVKHVDQMKIVDDGSTDSTSGLLEYFAYQHPQKVFVKTIEHTGLCEMGRIEALQQVKTGSWVIMLDADERLSPSILEALGAFLDRLPDDITHIWFKQDEYIDGVLTKSFAKVKIFKKESVILPETIHGDPQFTGRSENFGWQVQHRKTSTKQIMRESEYLETYKKLLTEGKIDQGQKEWFEGMHYFIKS